MGMRSKLLDENVVSLAKEGLKKLGKDALLARKLEAVIAAGKYSISEVAKVYDISRTSLTEWIKRIKDGKLEKLKAPPERKRKSLLVESDREKIKKWIEENPGVTIKYLVHKIKEELSKDISKSTVHREVQRMKYSYITPRKQHIKQDKELVSEFKKKYSG